MVFSPLLRIYCQVILPCMQPSTISNSEKMDTNAQWFYSSWSILFKRVNIRVRGFHLVIKWVTSISAFDIKAEIEYG